MSSHEGLGHTKLHSSTPQVTEPTTPKKGWWVKSAVSADRQAEIDALAAAENANFHKRRGTMQQTNSPVTLNAEESEQDMKPRAAPLLAQRDPFIRSALYPTRTVGGAKDFPLRGGTADTKKHAHEHLMH